MSSWLRIGQSCPRTYQTMFTSVDRRICAKEVESSCQRTAEDSISEWNGHIGATHVKLDGYGSPGTVVNFLRTSPAAKQKPGDRMYSRWHRSISEGLGFS